MEKTLMMPASYNVMNEQEMTYTQGGASAFEALVAWIIPPYGWYKGLIAVRDYRRQHPNNWVDTGLNALNRHMSSSLPNMVYDLACATYVVGSSLTGVGLIVNTLLVLS